MSSVLQGGRRKRRATGPVVALLVVLAPVAVAVAAWLALHSGGDRPARTARPAQQVLPAATPSPATSAPDPAAAALAGLDAFGVNFKDPPRAGIVIDLKTGEVLWRRNPVRRLPIASLTKVMTALLVVERTGPRDEFRIPKDALDYQGSGVGMLPKGRHVTVEAILHGLLLPSGNDAAIALADHVSGSRAAFVRDMNDKARVLGLRCTRFETPYGLSDKDVSCAADLAALSRIAMSKTRIARIVGKAHAAVRFPIKGGRLFLNNTNPLLRMRYPGTLGLKTGDTDAAGHCLIAVVRRGGRTLAAIVLNSPNPQLQVRRLFAKAFSSRV
jgi:D-alanyl-D-alanine carboxypeptidase